MGYFSNLALDDNHSYQEEEMTDKKTLQILENDVVVMAWVDGVDVTCDTSFIVCTVEEMVSEIEKLTGLKAKHLYTRDDDCGTDDDGYPDGYSTTTHFYELI